jgi:hypothetical protein
MAQLRDHLKEIRVRRTRTPRSPSDQGRWAKHSAGLFPGAACCHPIELPNYKAAPLQALEMR